MQQPKRSYCKLILIKLQQTGHTVNLFLTYQITAICFVFIKLHTRICFVFIKPLMQQPNRSYFKLNFNKLLQFILFSSNYLCGSQTDHTVNLFLTSYWVAFIPEHKLLRSEVRIWCSGQRYHIVKLNLSIGHWDFSYCDCFTSFWISLRQNYRTRYEFAFPFSQKIPSSCIQSAKTHKILLILSSHSGNFSPENLIDNRKFQPLQNITTKKGHANSYLVL